MNHLYVCIKIQNRIGNTGSIYTKSIQIITISISIPAPVTMVICNYILRWNFHH